MYNQESENVYGQESVPYESYESQQSHESHEIVYTEPYPTYQPNAPYPPYSSYQPVSPNAPQYSEYSRYSHYPRQPEHPYREGKVQRPLFPENKPRRVTKAEALEMVSRFKQWIVIGSVLVFGVLSGLAVTHVTGVTSQAASGIGLPTHDDDHGPAQQFNPPSQSGSLQQQQGGFGFGNNGPSQGPVSGSSVS